MASRVNQNSTTAEKFRNIRTNPTTGEKDYYYPLEVTDDSILVYAREHNLEVGPARLGYRKFRAVFVPCKEQAIDSHGHVTFLDTPSDVQRRRYLDLIKDEMDAQERAKEDGRCCISDGRGGIKRCPLRVPNPEFTPENSQPKTVAVRCEGCVYEAFKQEHTFVTLSTLEQENDAQREEISLLRTMYEELKRVTRERNGKLPKRSRLEKVTICLFFVLAKKARLARRCRSGTHASAKTVHRTVFFRTAYAVLPPVQVSPSV